MQTLSPSPRLLVFFFLVLCQRVPCQGQPPQDLAARRQEYAILAKNVVPPLCDGQPTKEAEIEPAVIEAKERWRVVTLDSLESRDRRLKAVAKEAADAHAALLDLAKASQDTDIIVAIGRALATGNPIRAVGKLIGEGARADEQMARYEAAVQRRRAATFLLPELAREFAGAEVKTQIVTIDFDENWYGKGVPDRVNLTNVSDRDLRNCTIQVDIRGRDGKWVRNIHFAPEWNKGTRLWADYASADPKALASISGTSAVEVQDLSVSVWCDELRFESLLYHYPGPARDQDRARQLDNLVEFSADYFEHPPYESGPCIGITMTGFDRLPACKLSLVCHGGGGRDDRPIEQSLKSWAAKGRISFQSQGELRRCPDEVELTVKLDGSELGWTKKLKIGQRR